MPAFDASAIIHAWDHYPIKQFPPLWEWMGKQVRSGAFVICDVAEGEVKRRAPDCHAWLKQHNVTSVATTNESLQRAALIEQELGIVNHRYNQAGVGENDILIVASACEEGHELVSNESRQKDLPTNKAKYKIPAVCDLASVEIPCVDFLAVIKRSGMIFDGTRSR